MATPLLSTRAFCTLPANFNSPSSVTRSSTTTTTSRLVPTTLGRRSSTCPSVMGYSITSSRPVLTVCSATPTNFVPASVWKKEVKRSDFPEDFMFGAGSAAYQVEGAASEGGRGPSIWDTFTDRFPEKIADGSNGSVANDSYNRYKEDVHIMKNMGLNAYRISISWSRILPTGKLSGGVNREGIDYYNNLINELLENGITPFVTLFHWDLPQALDDEYGGFLSENIVNDFRDYANLCFWEFGDRVKNWITLNEPWTYSFYGHHKCAHPPGGYYPWNSKSQLNMYDVTHNLLLAHANAADLYKKNYQKVQNGKIGMVNVIRWFKTAEGHEDAGERETDFMLGWFMNPLTTGEYPKSMRDRVKDLPHFSKNEQKLLKNSCDFIGLNYYTAYYALDKDKYQESDYHGAENSPDYEKPFVLHPFSDVLLTDRWNGQAIGEKASSWLYVCPEGLGHVLLNLKKKYDTKLIYVTENGICDKYDVKGTNLSEVCNDERRKKYIQDHLLQVKEARNANVNVMGYFVWSLMDNFEWADGYLTRFGLIHVDYKNNLARHPKDSALWYMNFLKGGSPITTLPVEPRGSFVTTLPVKAAKESPILYSTNGILSEPIELPS
ncbi:beta-glucosidase 24-like [Cornus florida]|uniref:beta-glucosidase 24-like n=1 Tax=Cornus florida TaxID=4283 RepID=UPI0028968586|nr:beta-glucosidase 24-like [Cornus florida]